MVNMLSSPLKDRYTLIHFESGSRGSESPAKDEPLHAMLFRIATTPFTLAWQIFRSKPAVVHLNSALDHKAFWRDTMYLLVTKLFGAKVIFQVHGGSLSELCAGRWMSRVVRAVFARVDTVVLLATAEKREFAELGIVEQVVIIPNAVDVHCLRGAIERRHSGEVRRLVYLGRLIREKGIFEAMEAVEMLRKEEKFSGLEFKIAGSGPAQSEIARYIHEHKLSHCVELIGTVYENAKTKLLWEADVFLFPTYHRERMPYSVLESLAAGTPVIASKVAGIPDVVRDRVHGILIKPKDTGEIVRAVRELARSPGTLRMMSKDCIEWSSQTLGLERLAHQFEDLYERMRA